MTSRQESIDARTPLSWVAGGMLSGLLLALTDHILLRQMGASVTSGALMYAAVVDVLAGFIMGLALFLLAGVWRLKRGRWICLLVLGGAA